MWIKPRSQIRAAISDLKDAAYDQPALKAEIHAVVEELEWALDYCDDPKAVLREARNLELVLSSRKVSLKDRVLIMAKENACRWLLGLLKRVDLPGDLMTGLTGGKPATRGPAPYLLRKDPVFAQKPAV